LKSTPQGSTQLSQGDGRWSITADGEDAYVQGEGPRAYFRYRDLGVAEATGRRIHIHLVRSTKAISGGTGWHSHSMGQLFYVLRGWADLAVERQPWVKMVAGDAMCIAKGMKHNVPGFSEDYLVLEMCIPADYDTVDAH
jgi:mannose-6-phosphate isomerase-like protein (cupin superfamily)